MTVSVSKKNLEQSGTMNTKMKLTKDRCKIQNIAVRLYGQSLESNKSHLYSAAAPQKEEVLEIRCSEQRHACFLEFLRGNQHQQELTQQNSPLVIAINIRLPSKLWAKRVLDGLFKLGNWASDEDIISWVGLKLFGFVYIISFNLIIKYNRFQNTHIYEWQ